MTEVDGRSRSESLLHSLQDAVLGVFIALTGAFLGAMLLILIVVGANPGDLTTRNLIELPVLAVFGLVMFGWWILPVGALFGAFMTPKIREWPRAMAWKRGLILGAGIGLVCSLASLIPIPRTMFGRPHFLLLFLPIYCALFCSLFALIVSKKAIK